MKALDRLALGVLMLAGLTACNGSKDPSAPQPLSAAVDDAAGDTYATAASAGAVIPDIVRLEASLEDTMLVVRVGFSRAMVSSAVGGLNVVVGYVDIDTDQNPATGSMPATDVFRPSASGSTGMGDEYLVSLWADAQGRYQIRRTSDGSVTRTLDPLFSGQSLELRIPRSALGGGDGHVNLSAVVGTLAQPTDIAPNNGHLTLGQPATAAARGLTVDASGPLRETIVRWGS